MAQPHGFVQSPPGWLPIALAAAGIAAVVAGGLLLPLAWLMTVVGSLVSIVLGVSLANYLRSVPRASATLLETVFSLLRDREVSERFQQMANSFLKISRQRDVIFRDIALEHLDDLERRAANIASGSFVFEGTEAWRIAYEQLLRSPGLHQYRSVAGSQMTTTGKTSRGERAWRSISNCMKRSG